MSSTTRSMRRNIRARMGMPRSERVTKARVHANRNGLRALAPVTPRKSPGLLARAIGHLARMWNRKVGRAK